MKYGTNYKVAVHWLGNAIILCNDITEKDESIFENCRFPLFDDEDNETEIYQWYLTDCTKDNVEWLEKHFSLLFTYSELLDLYVLCVPHFGTSWSYVYCECDFEQAARELGQEK